ncbi:RAD55 family ATPase [Salinigranum halophilum]|jgi:KaiC/GvpD/RAD55 family RecA-like ATPase|uniref:RAD55 family ATPase n=1 Tax=Salinigranum halophilum TaxID=2565931 RepID=UPI0010A94591|nr:recombinase RecA [Salinigranum halophilum]
MYDLSPALDATVQPGTNILLAGPPLTGKRSLGFDVVAGGLEAGEGAVVVSTKDSAQRVLNEFESRFEIEGKPLTVIDCVTRQQGISDVTENDHVKYASSPVDMTGIGIKFSEVLEEYYQTREIKQNRVMLHSLSTLLMYSDLQTVFRFLHVFTGRVQSIDGLGLFSIDSTAHDDQTMNTLKQLFDGIVTTHEEGEPTVRLP